MLVLLVPAVVCVGVRCDVVKGLRLLLDGGGAETSTVWWYRCDVEEGTGSCSRCCKSNGCCEICDWECSSDGIGCCCCCCVVDFDRTHGSSVVCSNAATYRDENRLLLVSGVGVALVVGVADDE